MNACPMGTMREACARSIEWMARGHVAHEHVFLLPLIQGLRDLPITPHVATQHIAAIEYLQREKKKYASSTNERRLLQVCIERVSDEIAGRLDDPMENYSDVRQWWPHVCIPA